MAANRLAEKGFFICEPAQGRRVRYRGCEERDLFRVRVSASVSNGLVEDFGRYALAPSVQAAGTVDPSNLKELEWLLREHRDTDA
jgi:hypothetical protein